MQFHILSFEGPDPYSRAGGLASRIEGLALALAAMGHETHLWFVGDPDLPGHERRGRLHLHRWCQWISRHHPAGVYDGEEDKRSDFVASLPAFLLREVLLPYLATGGPAVVMAEEWHTVHAVLHLDELLRRCGSREDVQILWNANNPFGFDLVPWNRLRQAATITAVSRWMRTCMQGLGFDPIVVANGLPPEAFEPPDTACTRELRRRFRDRTLLVKMARFDPDKNWRLTMDCVAELRRRGARPLLLARGGLEAHGDEVMAHAGHLGLRIGRRFAAEDGPVSLLQELQDLDQVDVVRLDSRVDPDTRRVLLAGSDAVLANSGSEPFGLVGLETMAVGGLACTGLTGEDYVVPGHNALVLQTGDPAEFIHLYGRLRACPESEREMRRNGMRTARDYAWPAIVERALLPRIDILRAGRNQQVMWTSKVRPAPRVNEIRRDHAIPRSAWMKKRSKTISGLTIGMAVAGLLSGASVLSGCKDSQASNAERNACSGPNGCGAHKETETNRCSGPNGCNGSGTKGAEKKTEKGM